MNRKLREGIHELIEGASCILMVTHVAPDCDAIGSLLGLGGLLQDQSKELILACEDPVPKVCSWLPGSADIVQRTNKVFDLIIALDCSDERRMGRVYDHKPAEIPLLNIDHHVTNTNFGTLNWVEPICVSTTQMVLTLADALGWEVTQPVAVCLLSGLVTDTRSFRTANVDHAAMQAALRLMEAGASLAEITRQALGQQPLASLRMWGRAIDGLHLEDGILWTEVTRDMRQQWNLSEDGDSGLTNFLSGVREARIVVVFTERNNGIVDVGMRSVPGLDVAKVALKLGGGGHPQAAGCTLETSLPLARERVLAELKHSLAETA